MWMRIYDLLQRMNENLRSVASCEWESTICCSVWMRIYDLLYEWESTICCIIWMRIYHLLHHMNESSRIFRWVMSHTQQEDNRGVVEKQHDMDLHVNELRHFFTWIMWMSYVTYSHDSCGWVMSRIHMTHVDESCHVFTWLMWMSHVTYSHDSYE